MIKLYLDEDVHKKVALSLRIIGYDVISTHEVENWGLTDQEQLLYAISQQRAIFTFNVGDFAKLHTLYLQKDKLHYGIILSKQIPLRDTISKLTKLLSKKLHDEIKNNIIWI